MFDWQTDETVDWEEPPIVVPPPKPPLPHRRWLRPFLLTFIAITISAVFVYRFLSQRVADAEENVEAEVLTSHQFVAETAVQGDWDLLVSFVSGRDKGWVAGQKQVVEQGLFYDRSGFGLSWQPQEVNTTIISVTFSPDLNEAEILAQQQYTIDIGNGLTETVVLQQTAVYRRGDTSWLFAPPLPGYWGATRTSQGRYLYITYPERDESIGQRLARDLDTKLIELCTRFADLNCPANLRVTVELSSDPATLVTLQERQNSLQGGLSLVLPAPTLLGLPVDEGGYQALLRGYARQMITAVIGEQIDWICCNHIAFYRAIVDEQLQQLGLQPAPEMGEFYNFLTESHSSLASLQPAWVDNDPSLTSEQIWPARAVVHFLNRATGASLTHMQRGLLALANNGYSIWLMQSARSNYVSTEAIERAWTRHVYQNSTIGQAPLPIALPRQSLQLLCLPPGQGNAALYEYDFITQNMLFETALERPDGFMIGLPDDSGVIVGDRLTPGDTASMFFWRSGQKTALAWSTENNLRVALPMITDPTGQLVLFNTVTESAVPAGSLPIEGCLEDGECSLNLYSGFPVWSPDGSKIIFAVGSAVPGDEGRSEATLVLSDNDGASTEPIDTGFSPFWLNNEQFGFVKTGELSNTQQVYLTDVNGREPTLLFTSLDLPLNMTQGNGETVYSTIDYIIASPSDPNLLFVGARLPALDLMGMLYLYNRQTGTFSQILEWNGEAEHTRRGYRFSPDGRFLLVTVSNEFSDTWHLYLYDTTTGDTQTYPFQSVYRLPPHWYADWSADGNWLSLIENGNIRLIAPAYGYQTTLIPDPVCMAATWIH